MTMAHHGDQHFSGALRLRATSPTVPDGLSFVRSHTADSMPTFPGK